MKARVTHVPDGWEVIEGDGEGLLDPAEQSKVRGTLTVEAGENVNPETETETGTSTSTRTSTLLNGAAFLSENEGWYYDNNKVAPTLIIPDGVNYVGVSVWVMESANPIIVQLEAVRDGNPITIGGKYQSSVDKHFEKGMAVYPGDKVRLIFTGSPIVRLLYTICASNEYRNMGFNDAPVV